MIEDDFVMTPDGMLSEQVDLVDLRLVLGLLHPDGKDLSVAVWDGERMRLLTTEAARKWADENEASGYTKAYEPVTAALRTLSDRIDEINTKILFNRAGRRVGANLAAMRAEGRA